jgi:hypothetical protein
MFQEYRDRLAPSGTNVRDHIKRNSIATKERLFRNSQSFLCVKINGQLYDAHITQDVRGSVKGGNGNYLIEFRDGVYFPAGTYIEVLNQRKNKVDTWIIIDALDDMLFPKSIIKKCTYNLKWVNRNGQIVERYIAFDDSSRASDSIRTYGNQISVSDGTIGAFIAYDDETKYIKKDSRFLIDMAVTDEDYPDTYKVTNRNALSRIENGHGVIHIIFTEDQFNPNKDDKEMMIADYYKQMDRNLLQNSTVSGIDRAEITYSGSNNIVMDTPAKSFELKFYDANDNELDEVGRWEIKNLPEFDEYIIATISGNKLQVQAKYNENLNGYLFKIIGKSLDNNIETDLILKVVSGI